MALREYTDAHGVQWQVWDVMPTRRYPPPRLERRAPDTAGFSADRRDRAERRRLLLTPGMESGWLCFESATEKRRLSPVPADWESAPPEALAEYLRCATVVTPRLVELKPPLP